MITIGFTTTIDTIEIMVEHINKIVEYECEKQSTKNITLEPALIKAIIMQECKYKPYSARYEKHLKKQEWYMEHIPEEHRTNEFSYHSLGPMQVMYGTARWLGFKGTPEELMNPYENIKYGVKYIKWLIKKHYRIDYVISTYNWGHIEKDESGVLMNYRKYVRPVLNYYRSFGGKVKE